MFLGAASAVLAIGCLFPLTQYANAETVELTASCANSNGSEGDPWTCDTFDDIQIDGTRVEKVELLGASYDDSGSIIITSPTNQVQRISTTGGKQCLQSLPAQDITSYFTEQGSYTVRTQAYNECRTYVSSSAYFRITYKENLCERPDSPVCNTPGPCQSLPGRCVVIDGAEKCVYDPDNSSCNAPGLCQRGPGTCRVIDGAATCTYPISPDSCDADGDQCTFDVCASRDGGITASCMPGKDVCGGIIPCGRLVDDPNTGSDETEGCSLCHIAFLANNLILFLFSIASVTALLALVIAGFLYISAGANPVAKNQAHTAIINIIKGYIVIFCAWLIVDFVMSAWGFINPIQGQWYVVCLLSAL